ncbi:sensor histidine kinase [Marivirga atlantica]|uniref:histidine kinase n=1 Tax=Marivirga atlantica TaxID=1548457 RepID=A0A937AJ13_9BACT|nr:HAMP domain-containing sensor histidine kinase [Marivirga atlantica]MBL0767078.1 HAMP domain-containing histidine kinase [Marivirga atlantica]
MILKHFSIGIIVRLVFVFFVLASISYLLQSTDSYLASIVLGIILVFQFIELYHHVNSVNYKLIRFLESVRYSDFSSSFTADNKMGKSFKALNLAFNEVTDAFKKTRAENEQSLLIVSTVLQNIKTGIIQFDTHGEIGLINSMSKKLLLTPQVRNMDDIKKTQPQVYEKLMNILPGDSDLVVINSSVKLSLNCTVVRMGTKDWKIVSIQNIHTELQQNELEAWQNLTKVLRHEIMNSVTPIATLVGSMTDILKEETQKETNGYVIPEEAHEDMILGLKTIENRSRGLVNFINAYRDYTNIPAPKFTELSAQQLIQYVSKLLKEELSRNNITLELNLPEAEIFLWADEEQIQLILINLIKNARESLNDTMNGLIKIKLFVTEQWNYISVEDNGPGIVPEALERIFIPFFTTKKDGSGIGLALSRQIMQLHKGQLNVDSKLGDYTRFIMQFPKK